MVEGKKLINGNNTDGRDFNNHGCSLLLFVIKMATNWLCFISCCSAQNINLDFNPSSSLILVEVVQTSKPLVVVW